MIKKYLRRTRKLLETKLCCRNLIKGLNTGTVAIVRYMGPFLKWKMEECTRKLMTIHKALHLMDDINWHNVSKEEGRRGAAINEIGIDASMKGLNDDIKNSKEWLITVANCNSRNLSTERKIRKTRKQKWEKEHGYFKRQTGMIAHQKTWIWLWERNPKQETKSLLIAAQGNATRINYIQVKINNIL